MTRRQQGGVRRTGVEHAGVPGGGGGGGGEVAGPRTCRRSAWRSPRGTARAARAQTRRRAPGSRRAAPTHAPASGLRCQTCTAAGRPPWDSRGASGTLGLGSCCGPALQFAAEGGSTGEQNQHLLHSISIASTSCIERLQQSRRRPFDCRIPKQALLGVKPEPQSIEARNSDCVCSW